jgi:ubiquitin carboxyl-terminal hydrolase L3
LANLLESCRTLNPNECAILIENSKELEEAYAKAASQGVSQAPNAKDEVECHYVCFVKQSGDLFELDGDMSGPVAKGRGLGPDGDILTEYRLSVVREFVKENDFGCSTFSLLGLVHSSY